MWHFEQRWAQAVQVESLVAFVAQQQVLILTFLTTDLALL